jgi:hypothetical protein
MMGESALSARHRCRVWFMQVHAKLDVTAAAGML